MRARPSLSCWRENGGCEGTSSIRARACNVFRFRQGRISSYEVYNDSGRFADALDAPREA